MFPFLAELVHDDGTPKHTEIELDFYPLEKIYPTGVTSLANVIRLLQNQGCSVRCIHPLVDRGTSQKSPIKYLDDSNFFLELFGERVYERSVCRATTMPLRFIEYEKYVDWIHNKVIPWLDSQLSIKTARQLPELAMYVYEIFNNIREHAQVDVGSVHMQVFPSHKEVQIAISDFGVGIPMNIRKIPGMPAMTDSQCLEQAIKPGVSSKSLPTNKGAGLDHLLQNVIVENKGRVHIFSKRGHLEAKLQGNVVGLSVENYEEYYPGTLIFIGLRTDTIRPEDVFGEVFEWDE